jgi:AraC-like DNA-binding protein
VQARCYAAGVFETIATCAALQVVRHATRRGIPALVAKAWLGTTATELDRASRLPAHDVTQAWEHLRDELGDITVGMRAALEWRLADLGLLGFCAATAPTFRDALKTVIEHGALLTTTGRWSFRADDAFVWSRSAAVGHRLADEVMIAGVVSAVRELTGGSPDRVELAHRAVRGDQHSAVLGCEVRFGATHNAVIVRRELLDAAPRGACTELWRYLCSRAVTELVGVRGSITDRAANVIAERLRASARRPDIDEVARDLGLGTRTLRRRLAQAGTSFRSLSTRVCLDQAANALATGDTSCTEAALAAGYSDSSAFARAWRVHRGDRPSRAKH